MFRRPMRALGFDDIFTAADPGQLVAAALADGREIDAPDEAMLLAPIESQEVWAAGVTYLRSKTARMEEAQASGGGDFYDRVYDAERPELFFKATPQRVVGPGGKVRIRSDSKWNVPEPELTLVIDSRRQDLRLHHRQRHELARHRGRKSPVPAAGEGLRRQLRRSVRACVVSAEPARQSHGDPPGDPAPGRDRVRRRDQRGADKAAATIDWPTISTATTVSPPAPG